MDESSNNTSLNIGEIMFLSLYIGDAVIPVRIQGFTDGGYNAAPLYGGAIRTVTRDDLFYTPNMAEAHLATLEMRAATEEYEAEMAENVDPLDDMPKPGARFNGRISREMRTSVIVDARIVKTVSDAQMSGHLIETSRVPVIDTISEMTSGETNAFMYYIITRHPAAAAKAWRAVYAGRVVDRM